MKKSEFLSALEAELRGIDAEERAHTLDYYSEIIDDCVENGVDEETAIQDLGSVKSIADGIKEDAPKLTARTENRLNSAPTDSVEIMDAFKNISISVTESKVAIETSDDENRCFIRFGNEKKYWHDAYVSDGTLYIESIDERGILNRFCSFGFDFKPFVTLLLPKAKYDTLTVKTSSGSVKVDTSCEFFDVALRSMSGSVRLEAKAFGCVDISSTSGSVRVSDTCPKTLAASSKSGSVKLNDIFAEERIAARSTSGSVRAADVKCAQIEMHSISGSVEASDVSTNGSFFASSVSGSVRMEDASCGGDMELKSKSGSVKLKDTICGAGLSASSISGSIRLESCDAEQMLLKTVSGSIKGSIRSEKTFDVKSASGSVSVPENGAGGVLRANSTSGSIAFTVQNR